MVAAPRVLEATEEAAVAAAADTVATTVLEAAGEEARERSLAILAKGCVRNTGT